MAAPGQNFNQTAFVGESPEAVSQAVIAATSGVQNYTVATAGTGSIVLTRKYTPTWAIVVGVVGLLLFLVGILALLVKSTETVTITITPVDGGSRVSISGVGSAEMLTRLSSALSASPAMDPPVYAPMPSIAPDNKVCPACAETVKAAATICRYCNQELAA
jgi:hypothetical protein